MEICIWFEETSEWHHFLRHAESIGYLVDKTKPVVYICYQTRSARLLFFLVLGNKELHGVLSTWPDAVGCDLKACKFHHILAECRFVGVQSDTMVSADVQPLDSLEKLSSSELAQSKALSTQLVLLGLRQSHHVCSAYIFTHLFASVDILFNAKIIRKGSPNSQQTNNPQRSRPFASLLGLYN